ncbi:MAG: DUF6665 family protein [Flavobacteriaceae bacterium]
MNLRAPKSVSPPRALAPKTEGSPYAALEHELFVEQAETLIRVTRNFEALLAAVAALPAGSPERANAASKAARALWQLAVQRDCMGLAGAERLVADYEVPRDIVALSGIVTERPRPRWRR